jgi:hypothetical protein
MGGGLPTGPRLCLVAAPGSAVLRGWTRCECSRHGRPLGSPRRSCSPPLSSRLAHKFKPAVPQGCMRSCKTPRPFREQRVGDGVPIVRPERSAAAAHGRPGRGGCDRHAGSRRWSLVRFLRRPLRRRVQLRISHLRAMSGDDQRRRRMVSAEYDVCAAVRPAAPLSRLSVLGRAGHFAPMGDISRHTQKL